MLALYPKDYATIRNSKKLDGRVRNAIDQNGRSKNRG